MLVLESEVKPRLGPAPLTKEDGDIWARVVTASRRCFSSHDASLYHRVTLGADRRDADLMLDSVATNWTPETLKCTWWGDQLIDVGGAELGKGLRR